MKWNNANMDELPQDGQSVLISVEGVYYITIYDASKNIFTLKDEPGSFFAIEDNLIYWTEYSNHSLEEN